jgi:phage virion morphogenesis protein
MSDAGDELVAIDAWMAKALRALSALERFQLFRRIGRELVTRNRGRMVRQVGPGGERWAPRARDKHGRIRAAGKMMVGLRAARRLKATASGDGAEIGWTGAAARIAAVHQEGALDYVDRENSYAKARYPVRQLIGLPEDDIAFVRQALLDHLSERL